MSTQHGNSQCVNSHTVFQMTLYREPLGENKDCVLLANKHCWSWSISEEYWTTLRIFQPWTCVVNQESNERLRKIFELAVLLSY